MPPIRIKICGITTPADAEAAARCGADLIGLNFYARSPRHVTPDQARTILAALPAEVEPVALYVHEPLGHAFTEAQRLGITTLQIHGDHRELLPAAGRFIPAFPVRDAGSLQAIHTYLELLASVGQSPAAVLVDAHVAGLHGGTGTTAPWHLLADFRPGVPVILAGGLTPDNVAEAIRVVQPAAVDVASGVESAPGRKDVEKMRRFIDAVRSA